VIDLHRPSISRLERRAAELALNRPSLARGPLVTEFEHKLQAVLGRRNAVAASSGTTALHLSVRACGWQDKRVVTSPYGFVATPNSLLYERAVPVFAATRGLTIDPDLLVDAARTSRAAGTLTAHVLGASALPTTPSLTLVEDASHVFGPQAVLPAQGRAHLTTYSFHQNKLITTGGEGGAVATDDDELAERLRSMRDHGFLGRPDWQQHVQLGYNYRLTELQAAIGIAQLDRLPVLVERRRQVAASYDARLENLEGVRRLSRPSCLFAYGIQLRDRQLASLVSAALAERGIRHRLSPFPPLPDFAHLQEAPNHADLAALREDTARLLLLPFHAELLDQEVCRVAQTVARVVERHDAVVLRGAGTPLRRRADPA